MNEQKLRLTYHPAKKEIDFKRFGADGSRIAIRDDSVLFPYMQEKGKFILQDHGDRFFQDIATAFDGEESVHIEAVMTKSDFEDLQQMIEHYNEENDVKINATLLAELPDMNAACEAVKHHGEKAIGILTKHRARFYDIETKTEAVQKCIDAFAKEVDESSQQIRDKIAVMNHNNIDLCFAGVYSCGKSTLINAILGYRILPEAISSKTARMFTIRSPKKGEPVRIRFFINGVMAEILWDEQKKHFAFGNASPTEDDTRKEIQAVINSAKSEPQHVQIYQILEELNQSEGVTDDIDVFFPIPLDRGNIQFTIYDTPGTDSNYIAHKERLEEALRNQTNSILIFVVAPNKLEGEGNNALLSYLEEAERKGNKTNIDIDRSLFVINYIDGQAPKDIKELQHGVLKCRENKEDASDADHDGKIMIHLGNKKLFFTSAKYGYAARATGNGIADEDDQFIMETDYVKATHEKFGRFYQYDRVATSECARDRLIHECEEKMTAALDRDDRVNAMWIGSGVFALAREIQIYGEKYAGAVKTAAIIESVDNALAAMGKTARSLEGENQREIDRIDHDIAVLKETLKNAIAGTREKYEVRDNQLPSEDLKKLLLDSASLSGAICEPAVKAIHKILKKDIFGKINVKNSHKQRIQGVLREIFNHYTEQFLNRREVLLTSKRDGFIADIKNAIRENGDISESAKSFVCQIKPPKIKGTADLFGINEVYNNNIRIEKFIFWTWKRIDRKSFIKDVQAELASCAGKMGDEYKADYQRAIEDILNQVQNEFSQNIDQYSIRIQALKEDKKAMEALREKIVDAENALIQCQEELNDIIWEPKGGAENG